MLATLLALSLGLTSGQIRMGTSDDAPFADVRVTLAGPDFAFDNGDGFRYDEWWFDTPELAYTLQPPGTDADFSGEARIIWPGDGMTGTVRVATPGAIFGVDTSLPFVLSGQLGGFDLTGQGILTVQYDDHDPDRIGLQAMSYALTSGFERISATEVSEPTALLAGGLALLGLCRWGRRWL